MVLREVQRDEEGAGWAGGVTGSPWKNVDVPYTPMGWKKRSGEIVGKDGSAYQTSVALAILEYSGIVVGGHVPHTSQRIVNMLTQSGCVGAILTSTNAEFAVRDEIRPFVKLL